MSKLTGILPQSNAELVRNKIGEILAVELLQQKVFSDSLPDGDPNKLAFPVPNIWVERFIPFDADELPSVVITYNQAAFETSQRTIADSPSEVTFFIDAFLKKEGNEGKKAMVQLQRLLYVIRGILMQPQYVRLGFDEEIFVFSRNAQNVAIADPNRVSSENAVMGRVTLQVKINELAQLVTAPIVGSTETKVSISTTDEGYVWAIGDAGVVNVRNSDGTYDVDVDAPDSLMLPDITVTDSDGSTSSFPSVKNVVCTPAADATVENSDESYTNTVASGGTLVLPDITVTDVDGSTRSVPSVQDVMCAAPTTPLITLYQRPLLPTYVLSYVTGDEGWQIANGLYNGWGTTTASNVTCQTQALDYTDATCRTLLYNNPFGNKLRFTDEAGGTTYANNVMIDNLTGIWWYKNNINSEFHLDVRLWGDLFPLIAAYTDSLGNNDYIFPPLSIVQSVQIWNNNGSTIQDTDFDSVSPSAISMATSSTRVDISTSAASISLQNRGGIGAASKLVNVSNTRAVPCRIIPQPTTPNP